MMLAAPELVIAEIVELLHEVEVASELQHRMLTKRVMRGEKGSEFETRHDVSLKLWLLFLSASLVSQAPRGFNAATGGAAMHFPVRAASSMSIGFAGRKLVLPEAKIAVVSALIPSKRHPAGGQPAIPVLMRNSLLSR